ncbi:MAG: hypothetical protein NTV01_15685 [Bacteroidia bacterium]|nr:hypothetical protein [Bacteroidia bacterium]
MKPIFKVAGILFLMYFHLMLVTAIAYKANHAQHLDIPESQENPVSIAHPDGTPQPVVIETMGQSNDFVDPVSDPDPESCIEEWMLDPNYLDVEEEPAAPIEAWMLDKEYLKKSG